MTIFTTTTETGEPIAVSCRMFSATLLRVNLRTHLFFSPVLAKTYKHFSVHTNPDEIGKCNAATEIIEDNSDVSGFEMFRFQNVLRVYICLGFAVEETYFNKVTKKGKT